METDSGNQQESGNPQESGGNLESGSFSQASGSQEASSSGQASSSSSQSSGEEPSPPTRGAWMGSNVTEFEIDWLYRSRRIPEGVSCRIPDDEIEPDPEDDEFVVFLAHFERGFGLPASTFFREFLDFYELQPHHLPGNAIFYLSCYATFMEAYIGIRPTRETFARFFNLRINSVQGKEIPKPKPPVQCGSCIVGSRQGSTFLVSASGTGTLPSQERARKNSQEARAFDSFDPDPYIFWKDLKMGKTPAARLGRDPPEPTGNPEELVVLEIHERVPPLRAEAGSEFVDKLMAQGQKNKQPASTAGSSHAPPSKRFRTEPVGEKEVGVRRYGRKAMPTASGPALKLGPRPSGSEGSARTSTPPPRSSPAPSGAGNTSASLSGGTTSSGRAAPSSSDHRTEEDLSFLRNKVSGAR
ncbi:hypothetical protein QYE76_008306 [Lolium multiflorum]|uniref:Transposase (putative) gypsy type domain-containing protein n=1 Tax=Lolium multiflorum TaxID=4521 RepID=A0AAD8PI11_LOLMU|nr:hypothetical protein QYE76_008306 [Lolium multiflorum]